MALKRKNLARQAGFTLLELMVVIVILGVLASMVVPNLMGNKEKADTQKATSDIVALEGSLDMYKLDNHRYPTTEQGLQALVTKPEIAPIPNATDKEHLQTSAEKNGQRHSVPLSALRINTKGDFPEEMHVSLSPQRLAATVTSEPQVIFLPDGEISRFTLTLQSYDKQHHFRVVSHGAAPVSVANDG